MKEENSRRLSTLASEFVQYFEEVKAAGILSTSIPTSHGLVDLLAEIEIIDNGATLHLRDITTYARGKGDLKGLILKEMLKVRTELLKAASVLGFKNLKITAKRHEHSTSANPGHIVDMFVDLTRHFKEVTKDAEIE